MKLYGFGTDKGLLNDFLTTASYKELEPILDNYSQRIIKEYDDEGNYVGSISHILRVFLIDKVKMSETYTAFLFFTRMSSLMILRLY